MKDNRYYHVTWNYDNTVTLVRGARALAKLLEPFLINTEDQGSYGKQRVSRAKEIIRAELEGTAPRLVDQRRYNPNLTIATVPVQTAAWANLMEGEYPPEPGRERNRYGGYLDGVSAVYRFHAPVE